jgi:hypothetical protein
LLGDWKVSQLVDGGLQRSLEEAGDFADETTAESQYADHEASATP